VAPRDGAGRVAAPARLPPRCERLSGGDGWRSRDNGSVPRLLVLGAGPAQLGLLEAARGRGLTVVAADRDPAAPGFPLADRRAIVSIEDEPAIMRLARAEDVDAVVAPGSDHAVAIAARIAARHGLPHPVGPEAASLAVSKRRQREALAAAGVPQPRSRVCRSLDEVAAAAEEFDYPVLVEASDGVGERGVALAADADALAAAAATAVAESRGEYCLVGELVGGRVVTVNGFSVGGRLVPLTLTDREQAPPPAFGVPLAHLWPAALEPDEADAVVGLASAAAAALGIAAGPTTTHVLLGPEGPLLAKLSARLGGGHDAELCRAALGIDLNDLAVAAALGEPVSGESLVPVQPAGGAAVRFLVAQPGELDEVQGIEEAERVEGVERVRVYRGRGHRFHELRRASDRAGAVLAVGADRGRALAAADAAAARIRFVTRGAEAIA
jgi:biotin carboxylase